MTWPSQVWHVFRKDVIHIRVMLAGYALFVAMLASLRDASLPTSLLSLAWFALPLVLIAYAMLMTVLVVLDESPAAANNVWRVRPLASSAVLTAKAAFALLLIAVALSGQVVRLAPYELDASQWRWAFAASIAPMGSWLLIALLLASVVRSVVAVLLVLVGILVASSQAMGVIARVWPSDPLASVGALPVWTHWPWMAVVLVASMVLLALYRRQLSHRVGTAAGFAATIPLLGVGFAPTYSATGIDPMPLSLQVEVSSQVQHSGRQNQRVETRIHVAGVGATDRVVLDSAALMIVLASGDTIALPFGLQASRVELNGAWLAPRMRHAAIREPAQVPETTLPWPIATRDVVHTSLSEWAPATMARAQSGTAQVYLTGVIRVLRGVLIADVPVGLAEAHSRAGVRVSATDTTYEGSRALIASMRVLTRLYRGGMFEYDTHVLSAVPILANARVGATVPLEMRMGSGDPYAMVLPGLGAARRDRVLVPGVPMQGEPITVPDSVWAGSRFMLVGWEQVGRYAISTAANALRVAATEDR